MADQTRRFRPLAKPRWNREVRPEAGVHLPNLVGLNASNSGDVSSSTTPLWQSQARE